MTTAPHLDNQVTVLTGGERVDLEAGEIMGRDQENRGKGLTGTGPPFSQDVLLQGAGRLEREHLGSAG